MGIGVYPYFDILMSMLVFKLNIAQKSLSISYNHNCKLYGLHNSTLTITTSRWHHLAKEERPSYRLEYVRRFARVSYVRSLDLL